MDVSKEQALHEVAAWMNSRQSQSFVIDKSEQGDRDQVRLQLESVTLRPLERKDPEDYVDEHAIQLHGSGKVKSADGTEASLPLDVYEIALHGSWQTEEIDLGCCL